MEHISNPVQHNGPPAAVQDSRRIPVIRPHHLLHRPHPRLQRHASNRGPKHRRRGPRARTPQRKICRDPAPRLPRKRLGLGLQQRVHSLGALVEVVEACHGLLAGAHDLPQPIRVPRTAQLLRQYAEPIQRARVCVVGGDAGPELVEMRAVALDELRRYPRFDAPAGNLHPKSESEQENGHDDAQCREANGVGVQVGGREYRSNGIIRIHTSVCASQQTPQFHHLEPFVQCDDAQEQVDQHTSPDEPNTLVRTRRRDHGTEAEAPDQGHERNGVEEEVQGENEGPPAPAAEPSEDGRAQICKVQLRLAKANIQIPLPACHQRPFHRKPALMVAVFSPVAEVGPWPRQHRRPRLPV
mmetsp:Transcript_16313/g.44276  ORF Transcript_16313/g.44276 Transcript_16313/m.44276 type:complete len:355 (+) Transcript_16313:338-1402(+)